MIRCTLISVSLESLFNEVYIKDIVERMGIKHEDALKQVLDLICSSIGSLTNPKRISDSLMRAFKSHYPNQPNQSNQPNHRRDAGVIITLSFC